MLKDVFGFAEHQEQYYLRPHYTPSIPQLCLLSKQFLSITSTELRYFERSVSMKGVSNQNLWKFGIGSQESMNVPIWIIVAFQQRD